MHGILVLKCAHWVFDEMPERPKVYSMICLYGCLIDERLNWLCVAGKSFYIFVR